MKTILKILSHKSFIDKNFNQLVSKLNERRDLHDISKFKEDEYKGFLELDSEEVSKLYDTDQEEYKKRIANNVGIELHYSRNSHHPEHYNYEPTTGSYLGEWYKYMSFLAVIEMVIDWKSACETYGSDFGESVEKSIKRFEPDEKMEWLIRLIAKDLYGYSND